VTETPLARKLRRIIEANGPMSVADYMAHCLGDPEHGYYMTRDPFGAEGDFVTAPEVSQMFGEIVGAWLVHAWRLCGAPPLARLVELGPGRGTLMADILRVASLAPEFREALTVHLVETSPKLRARQAEALAAHECQWHDNLADVPAGPLLLVANEFFDALPIRQFIRIEGAWRERVVGLDAQGKLGFGVGPGLLGDGPPALEGAILELGPAADSWVAEIGHRIVEHGGAALVVDYGHAESAPGETLQAVRRHAYADPLAAPGEADLTAHVDFAALARRAVAEGAAVHGPVTQGEFLLGLGLRERAGKLGASADDATREAIRNAVERLAGPGGMGTLFKVLALTRPTIAPPPFPAAI
jgi:NADH dehydrogenase [ubiquinone] 1 alpha subcomplex assembly factor 7